MLSDSPAAAILPAMDMARAKDFYQNKLGLKLTPMPMEDPMIFEAGKGTTIVVYHRAEGTKAEHTAAGFLVDDVAATIKDLEAKGVVFEDYDMPGLKTVDHIMDYGQGKSAWFKDTEGNILAINQM
ncbi:MAG TPA: VOC family protein [Candidatus Pristimantibacillus sp.]|jgi:predicted enzyme related to lactoylglutathione lyase|nr:VOC family protein [Candidatus Pristimantibacillus sp.]